MDLLATTSLNLMSMGKVCWPLRLPIWPASETSAPPAKATLPVPSTIATWPRQPVAVEPPALNELVSDGDMVMNKRRWALNAPAESIT